MNGRDGVDSEKEERSRALREELLISELQLLLAEKRTSLSTMRTGIAVLTLPMSVFTVLVATSRYYDITDIGTMSFALPLIAISIGLIIFGVMLVNRSLKRVKRCDAKISKLRKEDAVLNDLNGD